MAAHHTIRSIEVNGGFLNGLKIELSPRLNCIIGGRGTGKTTILELVRFALKEPADPTKRNSAELRKLVSANLRAGHVRVGIETRQGMRYTIVRSGTGETTIEDEKGKPTGLTLAHGGLFELDVFSAHEIEGIAVSPRQQLEILDRFAREESRGLAHELRRIEAELSANAVELVRMAGLKTGLAELESELRHVDERLRAFQAGARVAEQVEGVMREKRLAEQEARELDQRIRALEGRLQGLARLGETTTPSAFSSDVESGPHAAAFARARRSLEKSEAQLQKHIAAARSTLEAGLTELRDIRAELARDHEALEARCRDVLAAHAHERESERAQEQLTLQRRQVELLERKRELEEQRRVHDLRHEQRVALVQQLAVLRGRRTALRRRIADELTEQLKPLIRVSVEPGADSSRYEELLGESLAGKGKQYSALVQKVVKVPPATLAGIVHEGNVNDLIDRTKIERDRAVWLIQQLEGTQTVYDLEVVELEDHPKISLLDGEWKDAGNLSTGQRCTAILPILLLESEGPLIVDQPEDQLDNAFIYERIVASVRQVKTKRQLLFVTHNPNIPVLGEAELVVVMTSTGKRAKAEKQGDVDAVKEEIKSILEGGSKAFERRMARYGY